MRKAELRSFVERVLTAGAAARNETADLSNITISADPPLREATDAEFRAAARKAGIKL